MKLITAAALLFAFVAVRAHAARGTDNVFGYQWRDTADGATYDAVAFAPGTFVPMPDNSIPVQIPLPWPFPYYGVLYAQAFVADNGWLSFQNTPQSYRMPRGLPSASLPNAMLAPFWKDLRLEAPGALGWGTDPSGQIERIHYLGADAVTGEAIDLDVLLFASGCIQYQYRVDLPVTLATVGSEDLVGSDGIQIAAQGIVAPGFSIFPGQAVEFLPPTSMFVACDAFLRIGCGTISSSSPPPGANTTTWCCGESGYAAQEAGFSLELLEPTELSVTLTSATGQLVAFILDDCHEHACVRGPGTNLSGVLGAGTYRIIVDGPAGAEGGFTLDVACTPISMPLTCSAPPPGTTVGGTNRWSSYASAPGRDLSGPEAVFLVDAASLTNVSADLASPGVDLDAVVLRAGSGEITGADAIAWGDTLVKGWDLPASQYLLVIDGVAGDAGPFTMTTSCGVSLECVPPAGVLDLNTQTVHVVSGTTVGGRNTAEEYACSGVVHDGPEAVYELFMPFYGGTVAVVAESLAPGLSAFIVQGCNEGGCQPLMGGACAVLTPGWNHLVVDGAGGAAGAFDLRVVFSPEINRWTSCEQPAGTTTTDDTASTLWSFDDGGFCWDHPLNVNYPDDCAFAMYLSVDCGTEFSLSLYDSESGSVQIFDLLRHRYVPITAISSGGPIVVGAPGVQWQTSDCDFGLDPLYDMQTVQLLVQDPAGVCGLYRVEFTNHSGERWDLVANCTGGLVPLLTIHDSLCGAMEGWRPLPQLGIVRADVTLLCPDASLEIEIANAGCLAATDVLVEIAEGGLVFHSEVVPLVPAGGTVTTTIQYTMPVNGGGITASIDSADTILECTEAPMSGCLLTSQVRIAPLPECSIPCSLVASATVTPTNACAGETITVSALGSASVNCPGGFLEYQLADSSGVIAPWQASPEFTGIVATDSETFIVEVRCPTGPGCTDTDAASVVVEQRPVIDPLQVVVLPDDPCSAVGIAITWPAAACPGGDCVYHLYRSTRSCADALTSGSVGTTTIPGFVDDVVLPNTPYFYVLVVERTQPAIACWRGPAHGGPFTVVEIPGGACGPVTDTLVDPHPDQLPRVGSSLRLGGIIPGFGRRYGETFVDLDWAPLGLDLAADEHVHVWRSERPDRGFALAASEPPLLQSASWRDANADDTTGNTATHIWHYLVYTVDGCENDNSAFDNP